MSTFERLAQGPQPLDSALLSLVAGGSPRGGWSPAAATLGSPRGGWLTEPQSMSLSPRGGW